MVLPQLQIHIYLRTATGPEVSYVARRNAATAFYKDESALVREVELSMKVKPQHSFVSL